MMQPPPDNIVWQTLMGPHNRYTIGTNEARRYAPGFPPVIGFADMRNPNFQALLPYVEHGEQLYCEGWSGGTPTGWRIESEQVMIKMIWTGRLPAANEFPEAIPLDPTHAAAALELASLTRPGPFTPRALELGEYLGAFHESRLAAMAGVRRCAGGFGEISGVCTHPDFQGRGLARRLVIELVRRQLLRNESLFLRVLQSNAGACHLYRQLGFMDYRESVARVISAYR